MLLDFGFLVYGDNALKKTSIFMRINRFNEGREDGKDDTRTLQHQLCAVSCAFRSTNDCPNDSCDELNTGKSSVHTIFTEKLELKKLCTKIVPKLLTQLRVKAEKERMLY